MTNDTIRVAGRELHLRADDSHPSDVDAAEVTRLLRRRYGKTHRCLAEITIIRRRIDLLCISNSVRDAHAGIEAFEIKVTRSDFLAEMKNPKKRLEAELVGNRCWFACKDGICDASEVPDPWGLYVVRNGRVYETKIPEFSPGTVDPWLLVGKLAWHASTNPYEQRARTHLRWARERLKTAMKQLPEPKEWERHDWNKPYPIENAVADADRYIKWVQPNEDQLGS